MNSENYQTPGDVLSFNTNTAVTKNLGVKLVAGDKIDEASVAGSRIIGVSGSTESAVDKTIDVIKGPSKKYVTSGAAYADGAELAVDAAGKFRTATAGQIVVAYALEEATATDQKKLALVLPPSQYRVASANIVALTDNTTGAAGDTLAAIPNPTDSPATADALRDDLNTNVLPVIRDHIASLGAKVNAILAVLDAQGLTL